MSTTFDVVGLGNAIVDVLAQVDDAFIDEHDLAKGSMTLIDEDRAHQLYEVMPPAIEVSGGSAANTLVGVASFGGKAAYIGKVRDDQLGEVFAHDIRAANVTYDVPAGAEGASTARCLIQVTPDAERTLNTFLGISAFLDPTDVDDTVVAGSSIVYCEGYLWDTEPAKAAIRGAMAVASNAGRQVSLTLSDGFCVDRHRAEWLELIGAQVDILFGNEDEVRSLYETDDLDAAITSLRSEVAIGAITLGKQGSIIVAGDQTIEVASEPVEKVIDTTGAGDLYSSGFLYGLSTGLPLAECGRLASLAASEVISHVGARPQIALSTLL